MIHLNGPGGLSRCKKRLSSRETTSAVKDADCPECLSTVKPHRPDGARARVNITDFATYASGAAECLHGKTGKVSAYVECSINADWGPAYLLDFDTPANPWWSGQGLPNSWWFPAAELVFE